MASLSKDKSGLRRILFKAPDGKRKTLYLGRTPEKQATGIMRHVERLVTCRIDGSAPPEETARWLASCNSELRSKLAALELAPEAKRQDVVTVAGLVERYRARPKWKTLKPGTQRCITQAICHLLHHFDPTTPIRDITAADALDFYDGLLVAKSAGGRGLAVATANLTASIVATMFIYAVDAELIDRNPFRKLPRGDRRGNNTMVSAETSAKVLAEIHGTENRLVFGLARWGGLRTISEHRQLRWGDVDWAGLRLLVHSPKTERHEGKETRWLPLFPEIAKLLEERFNEAEEGEEFILPSYRLASGHKATKMLCAALRRAKVEPWSRLFHSLRASRQSELAEQYPAHVVSAWIGNSVAIGEKHYMMVNDGHFEKATQNPTQTASATNRQTSTPEGAEVLTRLYWPSVST
ncbi:MAG: site-specific integrase [Pirellulales bacterium]|nr:site-specific integrase [Pirellulales bacterium]